MNENKVHIQMHKSRKQFLSLLIISLLNFLPTLTGRVFAFDVATSNVISSATDYI